VGAHVRLVREIRVDERSHHGVLTPLEITIITVKNKKKNMTPYLLSYYKLEDCDTEVGRGQGRKPQGYTVGRFTAGDHTGETRLRMRKMLQIIDAPPGSRILLLGEREGILARYLAELTQVEVIWLEPGGGPEAETVTYAPQTHGYTRLMGDLQRLPFPDATFDVIASQLFLEHLDEQEETLAEWTRVLKNGGILALSTRNRLYKGSELRPVPKPRRTNSPDELKGMVEGLGLKVTGVSSLLPDLKLSALYRGDLSFCAMLEGMPYFGKRGRYLFLRAVKVQGIRNE